MVHTPVGSHRRSPVPIMEPAIPTGADIAAALFSRPAAIKEAAAAIDDLAPFSVTRQADPSRTTLIFAGVMNATTVHQMRDAAFTEIGLRPRVLCLDLTEAGLPDAVATEALVTIGNVARMMGMKFCVRVSPSFARILEETSLSRLVPLDTDNPIK